MEQGRSAGQGTVDVNKLDKLCQIQRRNKLFSGKVPRKTLAGGVGELNCDIFVYEYLTKNHRQTRFLKTRWYSTCM